MNENVHRGRRGAARRAIRRKGEYGFYGENRWKAHGRPIGPRRRRAKRPFGRAEAPMRVFSASDAAKRFGALLAAADHGPVTIAKAGRPCAVIISTRLFARYDEAYEKANGERCADLILRSIDLVKEGKLGRGQRALALARRLRLHDENPGDAKAVDSLLNIVDR